ncbi:UDP-glucose 6-dehydrogenase 4 [Acorus calamus]|uniref:UDP-glucose 6-dehydrogenase 4 n=1 Tax=Acorus calamus TaxID=4465 RepID=A0AAV9FBQ3_ACOCL|nr:UDP-glucose 6-dehydrogenase 4 [Acorus calamus]
MEGWEETVVSGGLKVVHPPGFTDPASYINLAGISSDRLGIVTTSPSLNPDSTMSSAPAMGVNLHFSSYVESHVVGFNIIFISVNTPTKTHGLGASKTANLTYIIVEKSTVPIKISKAIKKIQS